MAGKLSTFRFYPWALLAVFALFMAYPLGSILLRAFLSGDGGLSFTFTFFALMLTTESLREVLLNSVNLALAVTCLTGILGYALAFVLSRYHVPGASLLHTLLLVPLVAPPFVGVLGVRQLFSRFGSVNLLLLDYGIISKPIDWLGDGGVAGIIALQTLHLVPVMYLTVSASLRNARVTLEEAASMCGASPLRTVVQVVLPLSVPGLFAGAVLVFIASFTDLGTPLVFEYRAVIPVQIYDMLSDLHENRVGYSFVVFSSVLSVTLFLLAKSSVFEKDRFSAPGRTVDRWQARSLPRPALLVTLGAILAYIAFSLLPQAAIVALAVSDDWFMSIGPTRVSLKNFVDVLHHPLTSNSLVRSLLLSAAAAAITLLLGGLTAFLIHRGRRIERVVFDVISTIPLAIPGIVFAFGFIGAFSGSVLDNRINPFPLLIVAYTIRRLPSMVRSASAGFQEASRTLEEAALMVGVPPVRIARKIVLPLMSRHLAVGAMLTFAYSMMEVSDGILLALEERFYPVSKAIYVLMSRPDGLELGSALGCIVMAVIMVAFYGAELLARSRRQLFQVVLIPLLTALVIGLPRASFAAEREELVVVSSHWEGIRREFERAFSQHWQNVTGKEISIRWLDIGGTSDIIKYIRSQLASSPSGIGVDVVFGGGVDAFIELGRSNSLQAAPLSEATLLRIPPTLGGAPLRDKNGRWFAAALSTFGIVYNKVALERLSLPVPSQWSHLTRREYFGLIGAADPRKSGSMHAIYEVILQGYGWTKGWEILRNLAANVRTFSGSAMQVAKDLGTGEIAFAVLIDTQAGDAIRQLGAGRLTFVVPGDFKAVNGDCVAMITGAPNKKAAVGFIEFLLSDAGQKIWYGKKGIPGGPQSFELGKLPVVPSIYGSVPASVLTQENPFEWSTSLQYDPLTASRRWNLLNDLFGAFVIDIHPLLKKAARSGAAVPVFLVSEADSLHLAAGGAWGVNAQERSTYLTRWSTEARAVFPASADSMTTSLRWGPSAIFFLVLVVALLRRLRRTLGIRRRA